MVKMRCRKKRSKDASVLFVLDISMRKMLLVAGNQLQKTLMDIPWKSGKTDT